VHAREEGRAVVAQGVVHLGLPRPATSATAADKTRGRKPQL